MKELKVKKNDSRENIKLICLIAGIGLFLIGILLLLISTPTTSNYASCDADEQCNYDCESPDPDCTSIGQSIGILILILALIVGVGAYSAIEHSQFSEYKSMELNFPRFMKDFSESVKGGMTFPQALEMTSKINYGPLSKEILRASNQVSWGVPFPKAIEKLGKRIGGSKIIRQAFTIINEAYSDGGNIAETMDAIALNLETIKELGDDRKSTMSQQIFIMYFIFYLFLIILIILYKLMVPMMAIQSSGGGLGIGGSGASLDYCDVAPFLCSIGKAFGFGGEFAYFQILFLFMCLIEGVCTGLLAGVIGEGTPKAGIKHAGIFVVSALAVFFLFL